MRDLPPLADLAGPDLRGMPEGGAHGGGGPAPRRYREAKDLRALPERRGPAGDRIDRGDPVAAIDLLGEQDLSVPAVEKLVGRGANPRRQVPGLASRCRHDPDVPAGRAEVAHETVDHGDRLAVGRPTRTGDLQRRLPDRSGRAAVRGDRVELRDPVVVGARALRRGGGEALAVRRPVVLVDVEIGGAHLPRASAPGRVHDGDALLFDLLFDDAGVELVGDQGAGLLRRALDEQERDRAAVRRPVEVAELACDARDLPGRAAVGRSDVDLELPFLVRIGEKGQALAVGRPGDAELAMEAAVPRRGDALGLSARGRSRPDRRVAGIPRGLVFDRLDPGHPRAVGRDLRGGEALYVAEGVEDRIDGGRGLSVRKGGQEKRPDRGENRLELHAASL